MNIRTLALAATGAALLSVSGAQAAVISWTHWTGSTASGATGSAGGIGVTYTGELLGLSTYPQYTPVGSFSGGTVGNAPVGSDGTVELTGGDSHSNTITFSQAVLNPVMAIWSLGQNGGPAEFDFTIPFTIQGGGASSQYGGSIITQTGTNVAGIEGNGVIQFSGPIKSISFTNPKSEYYYGFTVGDAGAAVPEPASWAMMVLGFGSLGAVLRRRRQIALTA